jgi:hypothetical protein
MNLKNANLEQVKAALDNLGLARVFPMPGYNLKRLEADLRKIGRRLLEIAAEAADRGDKDAEKAAIAVARSVRDRVLDVRADLKAA